MGARLFFGSGTVPKTGDSKVTLLAKWLTALQTALGGGAQTKNWPMNSDSVRTLESKIERVKSGN